VSPGDGGEAGAFMAHGASKSPGPGAEGRDILLVAYFYPPCRDTGAQRPAAMAKWLRRLGHRVTVLTTSAYGEGPHDADEPVVRTADAQRWRARLSGRARFASMYDSDVYSGRPHPLNKVLVPEPLVAAWAPFARRRALRLHRRTPFDCVITSSPPESAHLVGKALSRRGVPWVADIRDAWTFEPLRPPLPTALQRSLDRRLERRWLGAADAVVCVSQPAGDDLRSRLGLEPLLVANGWDPEAVEADPATPAEVQHPTGPGAMLDPDRVSLVYTGRFGSHARDPVPLIDGLRALARDDPSSAARLELVVAGPLTETERPLFATAVDPARIVLAGSLARADALALQRAADALLLVASPARSQSVTVKLFEYLAAGRPVIALAGGTETGRIALDLGLEVVRGDDPDAIASALRRLLAGELRPPARGAVEPYTYPRPAERMATAVERAIARVGSRRFR
jgi:glycosyltransferase involved in cell wall biosynthesis